MKLDRIFFVLTLILALLGCASVKGSTVSATVSGKKADIAVTAPDGSAYGLLVENHQACVTMAEFIKLPGSTLECQPACGALVQGGVVVTVSCRVIGQTQAFPIQFAIPVGSTPAAKTS